VRFRLRGDFLSQKRKPHCGDCECESIPHLSRIGRSPKTNFPLTDSAFLRKGGGSHIASRRTTSFWTSGCFCGHHMWVDRT
jgi:hypothetical protein